MYSVIVIALISTFGYLLVGVIAPKSSTLEKVGLSNLLGMGITTLVMFCYSSLGVKISLNSTLMAIIILLSLSVVAFKVFRRSLDINFRKSLASILNMGFYEKLIIALIFFLFVGSLTLSTYFPVYIWDALALYDFRAKIIAQQGFYAQIANNYFWFSGYPLFTSLSHTIVYLFGGSNPQFLYSLMYLSFVLVFYSNLRKFTSRKTALLVSLLLMSTPVLFDHSTFAYTNLPYSIFLSLGAIYLFVGLVNRDSLGDIAIAGILTGLSTWTRSTEPFWAMGITFFLPYAFGNFRKTTVPFVIYILIVLLLRWPWSYVNYYFLGDGGSTSLAVAEINSYTSAFLGLKIDAPRIYEIGKYVYINVIKSWFPMLFLFIFSVFMNIKKIHRLKSTVFLCFIVAYFVLMVYSTYIYSFGVSYWNIIPDSARRMAMFFMPLMIFYFGLSLGEAGNKKNRSAK